MDRVTVSVGGVNFALARWGSLVESYASGKRFERNEVEFILRVTNDNSVFLDVGANVGLFSVAVATKFPDVRCVAFEPATETAAILRQNIDLNRLANIEIIKSGVGACSQRKAISASPNDQLRAIGPIAADSEEIDIVSLDTFCAARGISRIDTIKMDIEGYELFALIGASDLLGRHDAPLLLLEATERHAARFGYGPLAIAELMWSKGYRLFALNRSISGPLGTWITGPEALAALFDREKTVELVAIKPSDPRFVSLEPELVPPDKVIAAMNRSRIVKLWLSARSEIRKVLVDRLGMRWTYEAWRAVTSLKPR